MENHAHAIAAVSFVLVILAGVVGAYYWFTAGKAEPRVYRIVASESVGGLQPSAPVTFKGLVVGHVQRVAFSDRHPAKVKIVFSVQRDALVTESTYAVLARQGIVGGTVLALKLGEGSRARLETSRQSLARIPLREGYWAQLKSGALQSLNRISSVLDRLQQVLDQDNRQHFAAILAQLDQATQKFVKIERRLLPVLNALPGLMDVVRQTLVQSQTLLARASQLAQAARQPLKKVGAAADAMQAVMRTFQQQLLPDLSRLSDSLARTSRALRKLSQQLQAHPQSLLFGAPEPAPGPGEPGFDRRDGR